MRTWWEFVRGLPLRSKVILFASAAFALIIVPRLSITIVQEFERGQLRATYNDPATTETATLLHPGDATTFEVYIPFEAQGDVRCKLLGTDVDSVLLVHDGHASGRDIGNPYSRCLWAISPIHSGSHIIGFEVSGDFGHNRGVKPVVDYRTIVVRDPPFTLQNVSTTIGIASAALSVYLLASGKNVESEKREKSAGSRESNDKRREDDDGAVTD
jgi:hypothetical protein